MVKTRGFLSPSQSLPFLGKVCGGISIETGEATSMNNAQLINQTSNRVEWYTPEHIIEAARSTMGGVIDLDPASCEIANRTVRARHYYTADHDGLSQKWYQNVWLNHPFGRKTNKPWISKLLAEYGAGRVEQACCITFASTSEQWFQPLLQFPICLLSPRVNYLGPDGQPVKGVTKGSCVAYLGPDEDRFIESFSDLGAVMIPAGY